MDISLCPYKYIFGKPSEGFHSYRIFDISILDVIVVCIGAYFISYYYQLDYKITLFISFLIGIIAHRLFCVETKVDRLLFGQNT